MIHPGNIELFGSGIPKSLIGMHPENLARDFSTYMQGLSSSTYRETLTELLLQSGTEGETTSLINRFIRHYKPLLERFERIFRSEDLTRDRALFSQKLAQGLFLAQEDPEVASSAMFFINTIGAMNDADIGLGIACNIYLTGARAHAGLMHGFEKEGYAIVMPDVDNPSEVYEWDVKASVDFVAIHPSGTVLLIDAKIDSSLKDAPYVKPYTYVVDNISENKKNGARAIAASALKSAGFQNGKNLVHLTIIIREECLDSLGRINQTIIQQMDHSLKKKLSI